MNEINYSCPSCHSAFTAEVNRAGQTTRCWSCGKDIQIPYPATEPAIRCDPEPSGTRRNGTESHAAAKGVLRAGWICFGLGMLLMVVCFVIPFYSPLFLAAFILSIVAIAQKRQRAGLALLLTTIFIPAMTAAIIWFAILGTAVNEFGKALDSDPQPIILPEPTSFSFPAAPTVPSSSKPASPIQHKVIQSAPAPKPTIHPAQIPSKSVSLESLLELMEKKAYGLQHADTSVARDRIIEGIISRTREALSDHALLFKATVTDVRMMRDGVCRVSFKDLDDGGLNENKNAHLRISSLQAINLHMDRETALGIHPGQIITIRAKASLSPGVLFSSNLLLDVWVKSPLQKVGSLSIQASQYSIHN